MAYRDDENALYNLEEYLFDGYWSRMNDELVLKSRDGDRPIRLLIIGAPKEATCACRLLMSEKGT